VASELDNDALSDFDIFANMQFNLISSAFLFIPLNWPACQSFDNYSATKGKEK